jgi:hypothetical protein
VLVMSLYYINIKYGTSYYGIKILNIISLKISRPTKYEAGVLTARLKYYVPVCI